MTGATNRPTQEHVDAADALMKELQAHPALQDRMRAEVANLFRRAALAPPDPAIIKTDDLTGADLDLWAMRAAFQDVKIVETSAGKICAWAGDGPIAEATPSRDPGLASAIINIPGFLELKAPIGEGAKWAAWFDANRAQGKPGGAQATVVGHGTTWMEAAARGRIQCVYGHEFDSAAPQQWPNGAQSIPNQPEFGQARAVQGPPPEAAAAPPTATPVP